MTRLILVRHGESNVTVARIIGGPRTCSGLSDLGRRQAEQLRDRWAADTEFSADVLVASQYMRAFETAQIIAPALGDLPIERDAGFGEHDPGPECDGLTYQEFTDRYPAAADGWDSNDPFATTFPGGETVAAFHFRVGSALRRTLDAHEGGTIVVACHGGVIDALLRQLLRAPAMGGFQAHAVNTSISEFTLARPNLWRIDRYNDSAHLAGLPAHTNPG
ncbi:MAG: histidine phosphatase family protein [Actinomycetota bacterium]